MKKHPLLFVVTLFILIGIYSLARESCNALSGKGTAAASTRSASGKTTAASARASSNETAAPVRTSSAEQTRPAGTTAPQKTTQSRTQTRTTAAVTEPADIKPQRKHGTAGRLSGRTVILSIFTDDSSSSWNFDKKKDVQTYWDCRDCLATAVKYLGKQAKKYGAKAEFIYDWEQHKDLAWTVSFPEEKLVREDGKKYNLQAEWALKHFDPDEYMEKYDADNLIYIFFFNTKKSNTVNPWTINADRNMAFDADIVNLFVRFDDLVSPPSTYAHEILHTFGAYDLYYSGKGIPEAYIEHLKKTDSQDIMYTVNMGDKITGKFTELDAYYVGLTDHSKDAERWGLPVSEHLAAD